MRIRLTPMVLVLAACSGGGTGPENPSAVALGLLVQPSAAAPSGLAFDQQPVVQLRNAQGGGVAQAGVLVTAVVASGAGSVTGVAGVRTDAEGKAAWSDLGIGGPSGAHTLRFEAPGLASVVSGPVVIGAGAGASLAVVAGNNQVAAVGAGLPVTPRVRVLDAWNNPVAGAAVTFGVVAGGGSVDGGAQVTAADGTASPVGWTLGPQVGQQSLQASLDADPAVTITFTATATVGPPAQLEVVEGDAQTATIGTAVATAPAVKLLDAFGNPIPGIVVTFTPAAGSGTVTGGNATTNAAGIARVGSWVLGFGIGSQTLDVTRQGVPAVALTATGAGFLVNGMAAGTAHNCASDLGGLAWCWGSNSRGQIGDGSGTPRSSPVQVGSGILLNGIVAGGEHACGLAADGTARCWGGNANGQLGDNSQIDKLQPVAVADGHVFSHLAAGSVHTCGRRTDGEVFCWGSNQNGRLGDGTTTQRLVPTQVGGGPYQAVFAASSNHTCALKADGTAWCWGSNANGRLGDGTQTDRNQPTLVLGGLSWQRLAAGGGHTCGLTVAGAAYCWGSGGQGQLGRGFPGDISQPVPVTGGHVFTTIAAGTTHSCAVTGDGAAWCWGENGSGRLGDGTATNRVDPVAVSGSLVLTEILAGGQHTCALTTDGAAVCWGRNVEGQLGDASTSNRSTPVAVKPPPTP